MAEEVACETDRVVPHTELDREVERSRRALQEVPAGKYDWKPHDRSMAFGYLADMVANIPTWIAMEVTQDELDVAPADGPSMKPERMETKPQRSQIRAGDAKGSGSVATGPPRNPTPTSRSGIATFYVRARKLDVAAFDNRNPILFRNGGGGAIRT